MVARKKMKMKKIIKRIFNLIAIGGLIVLPFTMSKSCSSNSSNEVVRTDTRLNKNIKNANKNILNDSGITMANYELNFEMAYARDDIYPNQFYYFDFYMGFIFQNINVVAQFDDNTINLNTYLLYTTCTPYFSYTAYTQDESEIQKSFTLGDPFTLSAKLPTLPFDPYNNQNKYYSYAFNSNDINTYGVIVDQPDFNTDTNTFTCKMNLALIVSSTIENLNNSLMTLVGYFDFKQTKVFNKIAKELNDADGLSWVGFDGSSRDNIPATTFNTVAGHNHTNFNYPILRLQIYTPPLPTTGNDYNTGFNNGYNTGYNEGESAGYRNGINKQIIFPDIINGVFDALSNILNVEIFPSVKLWYIIGVPLILGVIAFIIGFFRGG